MPASRFATCLALLSLAVAAAAPHPASAKEKALPRTVTVSATGQVEAEPDMARISTGVVTESKSAREALTANSDDMKKLIESLKASGVEAKDIQTSSFNVEPRYTNPREGEAAVINGYRVVNQVEVRVRDLKRVGEVLDNLVSLGANQTSGLAFEVSKAETLKDDARKEAVANARRRAELFAAAAGAELGDVVSISEEGGYYAPPVPMARAAMSAEAVPVERGTQTLEARVTITWKLK